MIGPEDEILRSNILVLNRSKPQSLHAHLLATKYTVKGEGGQGPSYEYEYTCTYIHYITLHYITLFYITLHCTLYCATTLHYITYMHM